MVGFVCFLVLILLQIDFNVAKDTRIVGGRPAVRGEIPYQVSLRKTYNSEHFCGGSLIGPKHVLTAAHCMFYIWGGLLPPFIVSVVAGQLERKFKETTVFRNVTRFSLHPLYNGTSMDYDVAVLELDKEFNITDNPLISVIGLQTKNIGSSKCIVSGWGVQKFEETALTDVLMAAEVGLINRQTCDGMYGLGTITQHMICAGSEGGMRDACQGDSGGPLLCDGLLTGIVSTGEGCGNVLYPGIYANVPTLLPWIEEQLGRETEVASGNVPVDRSIFSSKIFKMLKWGLFIILGFINFIFVI